MNTNRRNNTHTHTISAWFDPSPCPPVRRRRWCHPRLFLVLIGMVMLTAATPALGQMVPVGPTTVSGHLHLEGTIDEGFPPPYEPIVIRCIPAITSAFTTYHCDLTGFCECDPSDPSCPQPPNSFCKLRADQYARVTGVADLNYALDIRNNVLRFSGDHTHHSSILVKGLSFPGCLGNLTMTASAESDSLVEIEQAFDMEEDNFVQIVASLLLSTLDPGTRAIDWWIIDRTTDPNADEFTPGAVIAEQHMRMCTPIPDDNLAESLFVQLSAGSYLFRAKYASTTKKLHESSFKCGSDYLVIDAVGPGTDTWSILLVFGVCPGDINGNNTVNIDDLVTVLNAFGTCPAPPTLCPADIAPPGGNGVVNIDDLVLVLNEFGACQTEPPGGVYEPFLRDQEDWYGALAIDITTPTADHSITGTTVGAAAPSVGCFDLGGCLTLADGVGGLWFVFTGNGQPLDVNLCGSAEPNANTLFLDALRIFEACTPSSFPACTTIEPLNHGPNDCAAAWYGDIISPLCPEEPGTGEPCGWDSGYEWIRWNTQNTVLGAHYWIFVHGINPSSLCDINLSQVDQGPFTLTVSEPSP